MSPAELAQAHHLHKQAADTLAALQRQQLEMARLLNSIKPSLEMPATLANIVRMYDNDMRAELQRRERVKRGELDPRVAEQRRKETRQRFIETLKGAMHHVQN